MFNCDKGAFSEANEANGTYQLLRAYLQPSKVAISIPMQNAYRFFRNVMTLTKVGKDG